MATDTQSQTRLCRFLGIAFGLGTQIGFLVTVPFLFLFLRDGSSKPGNWFAIDAVLALQFAVVHSAILLPATRSRISRVLPSQLYGSVFAVATCATLWSMFLFWHASTHTLWEASGWTSTAIEACFYLSWVALFLSLRISGFGYQTGWTQWLYWYHREPLPRRSLSTHGPYRWMRHPAYASFLGLIWFTPHMTADHAVLTITWTAYIFVGSYLKDRRLLFYAGDAYREYARNVPGYPGMFFGPLAKWPGTKPTPKPVLVPSVAMPARQAA
jgi:protein-S-isoprenylcysteine O-methyltransferase Ste14